MNFKVGRPKYRVGIEICCGTFESPHGLPRITHISLSLSSLFSSLSSFSSFPLFFSQSLPYWVSILLPLPPWTRLNLFPPPMFFLRGLSTGLQRRKGRWKQGSRTVLLLFKYRVICEQSFCFSSFLNLFPQDGHFIEMPSHMVIVKGSGRGNEKQ